ncbi:MAG: hypothetical protein Q7K39_04050 [Candidatus Magasanikbacteria bacterium]|nr:hypothetical protein [Candidatus Magasanikbacteria bacterium]
MTHEGSPDTLSPSNQRERPELGIQKILLAQELAYHPDLRLEIKTDSGSYYLARVDEKSSLKINFYKRIFLQNGAVLDDYHAPDNRGKTPGHIEQKTVFAGFLLLAETNKFFLRPGDRLTIFLEKPNHLSRQPTGDVSRVILTPINKMRLFASIPGSTDNAATSQEPELY